MLPETVAPPRRHHHKHRNMNNQSSNHQNQNANHAHINRNNASNEDNVKPGLFYTFHYLTRMDLFDFFIYNIQEITLIER